MKNKTKMYQLETIEGELIPFANLYDLCVTIGADYSKINKSKERVIKFRDWYIIKPKIYEVVEFGLTYITLK